MYFFLFSFLGPIKYHRKRGQNAHFQPFMPHLRHSSGQQSSSSITRIKQENEQAIKQEIKDEPMDSSIETTMQHSTPIKQEIKNEPQDIGGEPMDYDSAPELQPQLREEIDEEEEERDEDIDEISPIQEYEYDSDDDVLPVDYDEESTPL